ncbi:MAG: HPr kinase/phosphorylase [Ruegeria sp.]
MEVKSLPAKPADGPVCVHASCVSVAGDGVLLVGESGAGKSGLALQMLSLGASLVGDDRVILQRAGDKVLAETVPSIRGLIEARGIGLLRASEVGPAPVVWVVDLDRHEPDRLPQPIWTHILGLPVPLLRAADVPNLAAALVQLVKKGRVDPQWPNT